MCAKDIVLGQFKAPEEYANYAQAALQGMLEKRPEYEELKTLSFDH